MALRYSGNVVIRLAWDDALACYAGGIIVRGEPEAGAGRLSGRVLVTHRWTGLRLSPHLAGKLAVDDPRAYDAAAVAIIGHVTGGPAVTDEQRATARRLDALGRLSAEYVRSARASVREYFAMRDSVDALARIIQSAGGDPSVIARLLDDARAAVDAADGEWLHLPTRDEQRAIDSALNRGGDGEILISRTWRDRWNGYAVDGLTGDRVRS